MLQAENKASSSIKRKRTTRDAPLDESLIAFLWILLRSVTEETTADGSANSVVVLATRQNVELVSDRDTASKRQQEKGERLRRTDP